MRVLGWSCVVKVLALAVSGEVLGLAVCGEGLRHSRVIRIRARYIFHNVFSIYKIIFIEF